MVINFTSYGTKGLKFTLLLPMATSNIQMKIYLKPEIHKLFKMLCAKEGIFMNDVAGELIEAWVREKAKKEGLKIED